MSTHTVLLILTQHMDYRRLYLNGVSNPQLRTSFKPHQHYKHLPTKDAWSSCPVRHGAAPMGGINSAPLDSDSEASSATPRQLPRQDKSPGFCPCCSLEKGTKEVSRCCFFWRGGVMFFFTKRELWRLPSYCSYCSFLWMSCPCLRKMLRAAVSCSNSIYWHIYVKIFIYCIYIYIYIIYTCKLNRYPARGAPSSKSRQQLQWIVFVIGLDTQSHPTTTAARRARRARGNLSAKAAGLRGSRGATVAARRSTQFRQIFAKHLFGADRGLGRTCNRTKWKSRKTTESTHRCFGIENFIEGLCSRHGKGSRCAYEWRRRCHRAKLQTFQKGGHSNTGPKGHSVSGDCPRTSWNGSLTSSLTDWAESQLDCTGSLEWTDLNPLSDWDF